MDEDLERVVTALLAGMDLSLVDFSIARQRTGVKVNLVLEKAGGVGLEDLTRAQKTIRPRLELEFDRQNLTLEITSPGLTRTLKNPGEYRIFAGAPVRLLVGEQWIAGILGAVDNGDVELKTVTGVQRIPLTDVRKAKLNRLEGDQQI